MAPVLASLDSVSVDVGGFVVGVVVTVVVPMIVYMVRQYVDTQRVRSEMDELRRRVDAVARELQDAREHLSQLPVRLTKIETMLELAVGHTLGGKLVRDACGYWESRGVHQESGYAPPGGE
jgi:hypothetical protein